MKEIVLDTETTGISIKEGHRIVEIGCIELENLIPTKKTFHCYLNPERKVSEKAFQIHGYSDEFLSKQKKFSEIVDHFLDFIKNKRLIIHNAEFDISHLNNELNLFGKNKIKSPELKSKEPVSFRTGVYRILIADITLSFDNVLGVVGAAKDYYYLMITGLLLSVFLVATLATYFANYIKEHKWLGYVGIFVIIIVALQLIIGGLVNLDVLSINEKYEILFSV